MAFTITENITNKIRNYKRQRAQIALRNALNLKAIVQHRIQTTGQDSEGQQYEDYTPSYKATRQRKGRQIAYFDWTDTGQGWASIFPQLQTTSPQRVIIEIKPRDAENQKKLNGAFKKRGNLLLPSKQEVTTVERAWVDDIAREINK